MYKIFPLLLTVSIILLSCSNGIDDGEFSDCSSQDAVSSVRCEDCFSQPTQKVRATTRASNDIIVDDDLVVVHGCDETNVTKTAKLALNSTSAAKFGLSSGVYVVEYILCYKNISRVGYDIWPEESNNCGYKPSQDFVLGNSGISMTKERGYAEPETNATKLKTFVLHVSHDLLGRKVDRYDPCAPKDIEWIYSISPQE